MRRGDALLVLSADEEDGGEARWYRCRQRDSGEEGWCPVSFLDCAAIQRTPLGREKALMRAGSNVSMLPTSSPLRETGRNVRISSSLGSSGASGGDPLNVLGKAQPRTLEEMSDRLDILSRALIREKEDRLGNALVSFVRVIC